MLVQVLNPGKKKGRKAKKYAKRRSSKRRVIRRRRGSTAQSRACGALATMRYSGVVPPKSLTKKCAGRPRRAKKVSRKSVARRNLVRRSLSGLVCGPGWESRVSSLRRQCGSALGLIGRPGSTPGSTIFTAGMRETGLNPFGGAPTGKVGVTDGLKPRVIKAAIPFALGVYANYKLTPFFAGIIGSNARTKVGNIATGLATAGVTLLVPSVGPALFSGGIIRVLLGDIIPWAKDTVKNLIYPAPVAPTTEQKKLSGTPWVPDFGLDGMRDLPVVENEEEAVP